MLVAVRTVVVGAVVVAVVAVVAGAVVGTVVVAVVPVAAVAGTVVGTVVPVAAVVIVVRALGVDRPHPPASTAATKATRLMSVASRLRCTIAIIAGPSRFMHDGRAPPREGAPGPRMACPAASGHIGTGAGPPIHAGRGLRVCRVVLCAPGAARSGGAHRFRQYRLRRHVRRAGHALGRRHRPLGPVTDAPGEPADEASGVAPAGMVTEELVRYFKRPAGLWWALLAVPWLGLGALAAEPHGGGVGQAWDLAAFGLWAVAAVVAALVVVPSLHRVGAVLVRPAPGLATPGLATPGLATPDGMALDGAARARVARSGLVASRAAAVCDVLFFMALALMIWQP